MENYKINRANKTFVLDSGEELPIPKDKVKQVLRSPAAHKSKQEATEKWQQWNDKVPLGDVGNTAVNNLSESTLGNLGDTAANYVVSGIKSFSPGEGQEGMGYIDRVLDHFYAMQEGRKESLAAQSERNPTAALIGQIGGMGLELGALSGLPAAAALPIMGAAHSETSFLEPSEKLPELASEAFLGYFLDKTFGAASKVAGHRQTRRGIQDAIRDTEEANLAEISRATEATEADAARFAQESAAREAELGSLPSRQQAANQQFVESGAQRVNRVAQTLGNTPIAIEAVGVEPFIEGFIDNSVNAASKDSSRLTRFLRSVFKGDKDGRISGQGIQKGMQAVDETIAKEAGPMRDMLLEFKNYITQELPAKLGNYFAYEKWMPKFSTRILPVVENDLANVFKGSHSMYSDLQSSMGKNFLVDLNKSIKADIEGIFKSHAGDFEGALRDGTIAQEMRGAIEGNPLYQQVLDEVLEYQKIVGNNKKYGKVEIQRPNMPENYLDIRTQVMDYPTRVSEKMDAITQKFLPDVALDVSTKSDVTGRSLSQAPTMPQIIPEPPAVRPAQTTQPNLNVVPTIPEPQGLLQRLAYGLEGMSEGGIGGVVRAAKDSVPGGILAKMIGVPVGKLAAGGAAVASSLGALTSPGLGGQIGRSALKQTAIVMDQIKQRAEMYPSHRGMGILEDPMERRSLVKEIEDDHNMRLEDKAVIQSKINRGQPLIQDNR